jgi:hypothetical protein
MLPGHRSLLAQRKLLSQTLTSQDETQMIFARNPSVVGLPASDALNLAGLWELRLVST